MIALQIPPYSASYWAHPGPRWLIVVRHARAEQSAATDLERRLLPRGAADAMDAGRWLSGEGVVPDAALVSAAMRAQETWASLAIGLGTDVEPQVERGLYTADPDTALDLVRLTDDRSHTLAVVGHNPTVASLASLLGVPCKCLELDVLAILDAEGAAEPVYAAPPVFGSGL